MKRRNIRNPRLEKCIFSNFESHFNDSRATRQGWTTISKVRLAEQHVHPTCHSEVPFACFSILAGSRRLGDRFLEIEPFINKSPRPRAYHKLSTDQEPDNGDRAKRVIEGDKLESCLAICFENGIQLISTRAVTFLVS